MSAEGAQPVQSQLFKVNDSGSFNFFGGSAILLPGLAPAVTLGATYNFSNLGLAIGSADGLLDEFFGEEHQLKRVTEDIATLHCNSSEHRKSLKFESGARFKH